MLRALTNITTPLWKNLSHTVCCHEHGHPLFKDTMTCYELGSDQSKCESNTECQAFKDRLPLHHWSKEKTAYSCCCKADNCNSNITLPDNYPLEGITSTPSTMRSQIRPGKYYRSNCDLLHRSTVDCTCRSRRYENGLSLTCWFERSSGWKI